MPEVALGWDFSGIPIPDPYPRDKGWEFLFWVRPKNPREGISHQKTASQKKTLRNNKITKISIFDSAERSENLFKFVFNWQIHDFFFAIKTLKLFF